MSYCIKCGKKLEDGVSFCGACGAHVIDATALQEKPIAKKCPGCGEVLDSFTDVCPSCGFRFSNRKEEGAARKGLREAKEYFLQFGTIGKVVWLALLVIGIPFLLFVAGCSYLFVVALVTLGLTGNLKFLPPSLVFVALLLLGPVVLIAFLRKKPKEPK